MRLTLLIINLGRKLKNLNFFKKICRRVSAVRYNQRANYLLNYEPLFRPFYNEYRRRGRVKYFKTVYKPLYKRYKDKSYFYKTWNLQIPKNRWRYATKMRLINLTVIQFMVQDFNLNYKILFNVKGYLGYRFSKINTVTPNIPFFLFNRWLRSLLFFYKYSKIKKVEGRSWLQFILLLNFKRYRFFPSIRPLHKPGFVTLSLGLFRRFTHRSRAWTKTRMSYLLSASFLRKVLTYTSFSSMYLFINRTPKHLAAILNTIQSPALQIYEHPFSNLKRDKKTKKFLYVNKELQFRTPDPTEPLINPVSEGRYFYQVKFPFILFTNSIAYAPTKKKKRGRIKRQNLKRIILMNRLPEYM